MLLDFFAEMLANLELGVFLSRCICRHHIVVWMWRTGS